MWTVHRFTEEKDPMEMMFVETGKPDHNMRAYELQFIENFQDYKNYFNNFILLKLDNTGEYDLEWIKKSLKDEGFSDDNILTAALFENKQSKFKCDIVGEYYEGIMQFYFEKDVVNTLTN